MTMSLGELSEKMRDIDYAMLSTHSKGDTIAARPMSNNREVDYSGVSWFFADESAKLVGEIAANPHVGLSYQAKAGLFGTRPFFLAIEGAAHLIRDKEAFAQHWTKDLETWWPAGIDTAGLVLIKISGKRAHYWDGKEEGELDMAKAV